MEIYIAVGVVQDTSVRYEPEDILFAGTPFRTLDAAKKAVHDWVLEDVEQGEKVPMYAWEEYPMEQELDSVHHWITYVEEYGTKYVIRKHIL